MAFDRRYETFWKNNKVDSSSLVGDWGIGNMKEKQKQKNKANDIWWHLEFGLGYPLPNFFFLLGRFFLMLIKCLRIFDLKIIFKNIL